MSRVRTAKTSARLPIALGFICILGTVGGIGGWAFSAPLASAVVARGVVAVDHKRQKIQHLDGGVVKEMLVRDGHAVRAGQVVVRLDATKAEANHAIVRGSYLVALAQQARLLAERDEKPTIDFPAELRAAKGDAEVKRVMESEAGVFAARKETMEGQLSILRQRIAQLGEEVTGLEDQRVATDRQLALVKDETKALQGLFDKGYASRQRLLALQREGARLEGARGKLVADAARTKTQIGETRLEMIQLRQKFRTEVAGELRDTESKVFDLRQRVSAAAEALERIEIRAPTDGTVVAMSVNSKGGVVKPGETIMEIVPTKDRLIVEAALRPQDIEGVVDGLMADLIFVPFKQRTTPVIRGKVVYVSADALVEERSGQAHYVARIEVSESELAKLGANRLQPGMPVEVLIRLGDRTAIDYLLQPIRDSMRRSMTER
jgi:HlyD family type I secretion membrane fusion protein